MTSKQETAHERWLAETWTLIEDCASETDQGHRVGLSPRGCKALLDERRAVETEAPLCVCGEPNTSGVQHRTDGPCFVLETAAELLRHKPTCMSMYANPETGRYSCDCDAVKSAEKPA